MSGQHTAIIRTEQRLIPMTRPIGPARRKRLKLKGVLHGMLAMPSTLAMLAPSRAWAIELMHLDSHQGAVLLAMVKRLYPQQMLDEVIYALVVKDIDARALEDAATQRLLADGVHALDARSPDADWTKQPASAQRRDVAALAGTRFWEAVRGAAIVSLYRNALAYQCFDYGAGDENGGELFKGLASLAWLRERPRK